MLLFFVFVEELKPPPPPPPPHRSDRRNVLVSWFKHGRAAVLHVDRLAAGCGAAERDEAARRLGEGRQQGEGRGAQEGHPTDAQRREVSVAAHDHHTLRDARRRPQDQEALARLLGDRAQALARRQAHARDDPRVRRLQVSVSFLCGKFISHN